MWILLKNIEGILIKHLLAIIIIIIIISIIPCKTYNIRAYRILLLKLHKPTIPYFVNCMYWLCIVFWYHNNLVRNLVFGFNKRGSNIQTIRVMCVDVSDMGKYTHLFDMWNRVFNSRSYTAHWWSPDTCAQRNDILNLVIPFGLLLNTFWHHTEASPALWLFLLLLLAWPKRENGSPTNSVINSPIQTFYIRWHIIFYQGVALMKRHVPVELFMISGGIRR